MTADRRMTLFQRFLVDNSRQTRQLSAMAPSTDGGLSVMSTIAVAVACKLGQHK